MQFLKRAVAPASRPQRKLLARSLEQDGSFDQLVASAREDRDGYLPVLILVQSRFISRVVLASCALMV
jgi:hypothetical protein